MTRKFMTWYYECIFAIHCINENIGKALNDDADTKDDEAAAMAAMFKAQTNVWEETQEKMSQ